MNAIVSCLLQSCCHIGAEIKLTAESLETVANRDWTKLDYAAIKAEGQKCNTEGQLDLIPANYRLDTNISASLHFEIYTAKPEQDPTSDVYQKKMMEQMAGGDNNIITT